MFTEQEFREHNTYSIKHYGHVCMCPDCNDLRTYTREMDESTYGIEVDI